MSTVCLLLPYHGWGVSKSSMAPIIRIFLSYHFVEQPYSLPVCFLLLSFNVDDRVAPSWYEATYLNARLLVSV